MKHLSYILLMCAIFSCTKQQDPETLGEYIYIDLNNCIHSRRCEATQNTEAKTEMQLNCRNLQRITVRDIVEMDYDYYPGDKFLTDHDFCAICFSDELYNQLKEKARFCKEE